METLKSDTESEEVDEGMAQEEDTLPVVRSTPTFIIDPKTNKYKIQNIRSPEDREDFRKIAKSVSGQLETL